MLAEVICFVVFTAFPTKVKMALGLSTAQPVEAHVHCLRFSRHHRAVDEAMRRRIVGRDGRRRLVMAQFGEQEPQRNCFLRDVIHRR